MDQRLRQVKPLLHTPRKPLDAIFAAIAQTDHFKHRVSAFSDLVSRHSVEMSEVDEVVAGCELIVETSISTEHDTKSAAHLSFIFGDVESGNARRPGGGDQQRREHLDRRRLTGSVVPEQTEDHPLRNRKTDTVDGDQFLSTPKHSP